MAFFTLSMPLVVIMVGLAVVPPVLVSHHEHRGRIRAAEQHDGPSPSQHATSSHALPREEVQVDHLLGTRPTSPEKVLAATGSQLREPVGPGATDWRVLDRVLVRVLVRVNGLRLRCPLTDRALEAQSSQDPQAESTGRLSQLRLPGLGLVRVVEPNRPWGASAPTPRHWSQRIQLPRLDRLRSVSEYGSPAPVPGRTPHCSTVGPVFRRAGATSPPRKA